MHHSGDYDVQRRGGWCIPLAAPRPRWVRACVRVGPGRPRPPYVLRTGGQAAGGGQVPHGPGRAGALDDIDHVRKPQLVAGHIPIPLVTRTWGTGAFVLTGRRAPLALSAYIYMAMRAGMGPATRAMTCTPRAHPHLIRARTCTHIASASRGLCWSSSGPLLHSGMAEAGWCWTCPWVAPPCCSLMILLSKPPRPHVEFRNPFWHATHVCVSCQHSNRAYNHSGSNVQRGKLRRWFLEGYKVRRS